jgi:hypothetical protein
MYGRGRNGSAAARGRGGGESRGTDGERDNLVARADRGKRVARIDRPLHHQGEKKKEKEKKKVEAKKYNLPVGLQMITWKVSLPLTAITSAMGETLRSPATRGMSWRPKAPLAATTCVLPWIVEKTKS